MVEGKITKCCTCKGPLPDELPYKITVCSANCFNKFYWQFYRKQMLGGGVFGILLAWSIARGENYLGVAIVTVLTTVFVMYKLGEMKDYPWD